MEEQINLENLNSKLSELVDVLKQEQQNRQLKEQEQQKKEQEELKVKEEQAKKQKEIDLKEAEKQKQVETQKTEEQKQKEEEQQKKDETSQKSLSDVAKSTLNTDTNTSQLLTEVQALKKEVIDIKTISFDASWVLFFAIVFCYGFKTFWDSSTKW